MLLRRRRMHDYVSHMLQRRKKFRKIFAREVIKLKVILVMMEVKSIVKSIKEERP